eukprot:CAMPEP_0117445902 /NCGR_PEP_ID=MMETSP0759-20121206/6048_1 /TAXON_ID=63605 /ORGANISM="Percolomonas cosmopolitus, Strain WS" /LENGTH=598 /DNA_ID=CAMNT_0005238119 /DNA_START=180 /DNA_END=1976 /DNA_ORIENTATION=+
MVGTPKSGKSFYGANFWDVLAPEDQDDFASTMMSSGEASGRYSAMGADRLASTFGGRSASGAMSKHTTLSQHKTTNPAETNALRLRPAAVQHRMTSMVQRTQSSMNQELKMRRKSMKHAIKTASTVASTEGANPRHRRSVLGGEEQSTGSGSPSPSPFNRSRSKSMFVRPQLAASAPEITTKPARTTDALPNKNAPTLGRPSSASRRNRSQRLANQNKYRPPSPRLNHPTSQLDKLQHKLSQSKKRIKETLNEIGYEDPEFYQFRIKVQNNSMMNIHESSRIFMIITQDDNPALTAKVHDLQISDDMYVLFPSSHLPNKSLFNPIDHLPWAKTPIDLFEHQLSVEIFVGLGVETSIIAKANVHYAPVDGIPLKQQGMESHFKDNQPLRKIDQIIDHKNYAPRMQERRSSEVGSHEDYVSISTQMESLGPSVQQMRRESGETVLRMPKLEQDDEEQFNGDAESVDTVIKRVKVLKIEMRQKTEEQVDDSVDQDNQEPMDRGGFSPEISTIGGEASTLVAPTQQRLHLSVHSQGDESKLHDNSDDSRVTRALSPAKDTGEDSESDGDDDLDEERMALMKSKQELKMLRERLKNRMEAGMV